MSTLSQTGWLQSELGRSFHDERQRWRERTLQGLLVSTLVAAGFSAIWFSLVPYGIPGLTTTLWVSVLALAALIFAPRRIPFGGRAAAFLFVVTAACLSSMLYVGHNPNALVGYATVAVAAALLFGLRAAVFSVVAMTLLILFVSGAHSSGALPQVASWAGALDSAHFGNGLRVAGIFSLLSASCVVGISYLLERTERLVLQQANALEALRNEQAEKERLRRELELQEAALAKARELETLGRLAGSMAHDFNNALLVIWAALDELTNSPQLSRSDAEAIASLREAAQQATATTRNLRAFGPLSPRRLSVLELSSVIPRARATLERVLPSNISLQSEIQLEAAVAADEGELLRVLTNLALNARDAMREGGTLTLRVRQPSADERSAASPDAQLVAIDVVDTGIGMAEDVKQRLFEPFFTTKDTGGTGLGLATVRDLARAHHGEVQVTSELGRGTTITLLWPRAERVPAAPGSKLAPLPSGKGSVILLVEDDPSVLAVLSRNLTRAGFTVLEAADAASGLELLRRGKLRIHALCTDWMMPGRPVRDLIDEFHHLYGGPVIVCSGYAPAETGISLSVVDDFLAKPFSGDDLVRRLSRLLSEPAVEPGAGAVEAQHAS